MFFLEQLLEARRDGSLNNSKETLIRMALEGILPLMQEAFPSISTWSVAVLTNRHMVIRDYWRAFLDAYNMPGVSFDKESGMLIMPEEKKRQFMKSHPKQGRNVTTQPLPRNNRIQFDQWPVIFSNIELARGYTFEAQDSEASHNVEGLAEGNKENTQGYKADLG